MFKTPKGTELPLLNLKGKQYLQVAYRIVWFLEERSNWSIETELKTEGAGCLAKATIKDADGRIRATSHKYEDQKGFQDFREKAETGAVGRALALCGFGTQFTSELDEGERIVDSPQQRSTHSIIDNLSSNMAFPGTESRVPRGPKHSCGKPMMQSKYGDDWYCYSCKVKVPKDEGPEDIPFNMGQ